MKRRFENNQHTKKRSEAAQLSPNLYARIENKKTGEVEWRETHNLVVTTGLNYLRDVMFGLDGRSMDRVAVGSSNTSTSLSMTGLQGTEHIRKDLDSTDVDKPGDGSLEYNFTLKTTEPSGQPVDIGEIALFADSQGSANDVMFSRATFSKTFEKNSDIEIRFFYVVNYSNP